MSKKFYRSSNDKIIAGVCGGLGEYFNIDPSIIRIFWLLFSISGSGSGIVAYIICAIVIPEKDSDVIYYDENENKSYKNSALFIGIVLILIGASLLVRKIWPWFSLKSLKIARYWPILLIIAGIYIIYNQKKEN
ncbi:PspC domain-containing protein [Anaerosalibacter bizertensis]|uniref:PspC domain-containing protein n=1 Tax=Anaerosalibacter bizertensis TaxID=932217 RepID=A0A844FDI9_9FIRM|nr:PspC domain-containing protein [Anaerosalibacter bizertensis]MBV1818276.1 PspC domain-containing protein [Bacteroidales bacterium MSK.15.36]HHV26378.1 PspC domain-containing protein [Tissierellia bacterium]MCB5560367.1 PspC domain-containing protein [Anaerosalibacter bizertensis]MCG4565630.1 PspC domain-containing protein [Anaerosalibacter bizertensis]MCG4582711.1 PspC domain-containing protein [Anaerosalibacter bizertensis]